MNALRRVVYRIALGTDGRWLLFRTLATGEERPVMRSGSTVRPASYPTRRMALDAFESQRRIDRGAGTRLAIPVDVRLVEGGCP